MGTYATEQGGEGGDDAPRLDEDLTPWLRDEWGLDVFLTEFPYFQYAGVDFPPEDDEKTDHWLNEVLEQPALDRVPDSVRQKGPYRTDIVGVRVDRRALRERIRRVGTPESMNGSGQKKRRNRRTYLSFVADGPMSRKYWEKGHGGTEWTRPDGPENEVRSYGPSSASRGFGWLKKRGFLAPVGNGRWDAVDLPLHVSGGVHAFELKISRGEWTKALKQASRADVYADYRWVVYPHPSAPLRQDELESFKNNGVGLITVHPEDGVEVPVWADRCTPEVDRELLDRYNVERWDVNERVLKRLHTVYSKDRESWGGDRPIPESFGLETDILSDMAVDELETVVSPPTSNGHRAPEGMGGPDTSPEDPMNKTLTAFGGDGDE